MELAQRAALAIDNARLYQAAQAQQGAAGAPGGDAGAAGAEQPSDDEVADAEIVDEGDEEKSA